MSKRVFSWIISNADTLIALIIAVLVSVLSLAGDISSSLVANATVATLAVLAFIMLHDRKLQRETRDVVGGLERIIAARNPIRILTGKDIHRTIVEAYKNTDNWYYRGPTANYTRIVVLPHCIKRARANDKEFYARIEILDPRSSTACERHNRIYRNLASEIGEVEIRRTVKGVQANLYATIVAVCWHKQQYEKFFVEIGLSTHASTFRWEASSNFFMLTRREERFPAMFIEKSDPFYNLLSSELEVSFRQAYRVPLELAANMRLSYEPTVSEVRTLLSTLNLTLPDYFEDDDVSKIVAMALHGKSHYSHLDP